MLFVFMEIVRYILFEDSSDGKQQSCKNTMDQKRVNYVYGIINIFCSEIVHFGKIQ